MHVFAVLADPVRRLLIETLATGEHTVAPGCTGSTPARWTDSSVRSTRRGSVGSTA
jgi:hypothetical protein